VSVDPNLDWTGLGDPETRDWLLRPCRLKRGRATWIAALHPHRMVAVRGNHSDAIVSVSGTNAAMHVINRCPKVGQRVDAYALRTWAGAAPGPLAPMMVCPHCEEDIYARHERRPGRLLGRQVDRAYVATILLSAPRTFQIASGPESEIFMWADGWIAAVMPIREEDAKTGAEHTFALASEAPT